ncbi:MAG: galactokinase [Verrucomicrobiales bacterium]|nr:galactokinase [Verrucomicrobiales bacterium]
MEPPTDVSALSTEASRRFAARFGREPRYVVAAPGRVNVIGEHTDYNDGFVLPMAIERYTVIAADPVSTTKIRMGSSQAEEELALDFAATVQPAEPRWGNYVRGVLAGFQKLQQPVPGFDAWIVSNVPLGGGLSSSASLEVAMATLLETLGGSPLEPVTKALICQQAEHEFAGVPCGIMDQFVSVMAQANHLLLLDCRSRATELIPLVDPQVSVLIINSNVKHELTGGEYAERRSQCEEAARIFGVRSLRDANRSHLESASPCLTPLVRRRARHVISEIERTIQAAREVRSGDWTEVGRLMYESHTSLRQDFEVSCEELDLLVDLAAEIGTAGGVFGSRMTGGGFGGCTVSLVAAGAVESIQRQIHDAYRTRTGIEASSFVSRPAAGARILCNSARR